MNLTGLINDKNSKTSVIYRLAETQFADLKGLNLRSLSNWTFVVGGGGDHDGDGLPDVYEELATRTDPYSGDDGYSDPDSDGWGNLQEMQNGTDPLTPQQPAGPANVSVQRNINGITTVTWYSGHLPDYFLVRKTDRILKRSTNTPPSRRPQSGVNSSNRDDYLKKEKEFQPRGSPWNQPRKPEYVESPPRIVAKIIPKPGQHDFNYLETNAVLNILSNPAYQVQAHFTPPLGVFLDEVNATSIRQTRVFVGAKPSTNGYDLKVSPVVPYAHYLLLVRDQQDPRWKASGYFCSSTNQNPIYLHVDLKGMMREGQCPITLPEVKFIRGVVGPEFTAGWGEDSDGDGLPDIYEVLVTQTDPANPDTGNTGVLDGYKDPDSDGISNLEEFRRRTDPLQPNPSPGTVELKHPTLVQVWSAVSRESLRTDIYFEPDILIRKPGEPGFHSFDSRTPLEDYARNLKDPEGRKLDFDVRISWHTPRPTPMETGYSGP
jgi:hypothetical protein